MERGDFHECLRFVTGGHRNRRQRALKPPTRAELEALELVSGLADGTIDPETVDDSTIKQCICEIGLERMLALMGSELEADTPKQSPVPDWTETVRDLSAQRGLSESKIPHPLSVAAEVTYLVLVSSKERLATASKASCSGPPVLQFKGYDRPDIRVRVFEHRTRPACFVIEAKSSASEVPVSVYSSGRYVPLEKPFDPYGRALVRKALLPEDLASRDWGVKFHKLENP